MKECKIRSGKNEGNPWNTLSSWQKVLMILDLELTELGMSSRSVRTLESAGITTFNDLLEYRRNKGSFRKIRGVGDRIETEINYTINTFLVNLDLEDFM